MNYNEFIRSTEFKILLPIVFVWGIITIFKGGVAFGQWIYAFVH